MKLLGKLFLILFRNIRGGIIGSKIRVFSLRCMGCKCAKNAFIGTNITFVRPDRLTIGNNTSIHEGCYIDASGTVIIGSNVSIAHGVSIVSFNHSYSDQNTPIKEQPLIYEPIVIENNVWIGCKVTLLAGTTIKSRTVVAANAVCNKIYEKGIIIGGLPGKKIKKIWFH